MRRRSSPTRRRPTASSASTRRKSQATSPSSQSVRLPISSFQDAGGKVRAVTDHRDQDPANSNRRPAGGLLPLHPKQLLQGQDRTQQNHQGQEPRGIHGGKLPPPVHPHPPPCLGPHPGGPAGPPEGEDGRTRDSAGTPAQDHEAAEEGVRREEPPTKGRGQGGEAREGDLRVRLILRMLILVDQ